MYFHSLSRSSLSDFSKATQQITQIVMIKLLVFLTLSLGAPGFSAWGCSPSEWLNAMQRFVTLQLFSAQLSLGEARVLLWRRVSTWGGRRKEGTVNHAVIFK